jgi:antibiotic biosynthesis monooxygenase (ABM) superfamily enzyme
MITRIWRGWTTRQNATAYQTLLLDEIFQSIASRGVTGYRDFSLLRRDLGGEVEFVTVRRFDSIASVKAFAGEDFELAVVPPRARFVGAF